MHDTDTSLSCMQRKWEGAMTLQRSQKIRVSKSLVFQTAKGLKLLSCCLCSIWVPFWFKYSNVRIFEQQMQGLIFFLMQNINPFNFQQLGTRERLLESDERILVWDHLLKSPLPINFCSSLSLTSALVVAQLCSCRISHVSHFWPSVLLGESKEKLKWRNFA